MNNSLRDALPALIAGLIGIAVTLAGVASKYQTIQTDARLRFSQQVERLESDLQTRFRLPFYGINATRAYIISHPDLKRQQFSDFWNARDVAAEFPGVRGFGFIARISRSDLDRFTVLERADGAPDFSVKTKGDAADLFVIKLIEPVSNNLAAVGFDIGQEAHRRSGAEAAMRSGKPTRTAAITLVQAGKQGPGFLYFQPVYHPDKPLTTPEQRSDALRGLAYSPVAVSEIIAGTLPTLQGLTDFTLFDGDTATAESRVFDLASSRNDANADTSADVLRHQTRSLFAERRFSAGDRTLIVHASPTDAFIATIDNRTPAIMAIGGILLSAVFATVIWLLASGRRRAERIAEEMNRELQEHRDHLQQKVEQRTAQAQLLREAAEQANQAKSLFLSNISHELRTPLHAMLAFAQLGEKRSADDPTVPDKVRQYFGKILASGERLTKLLDSLLNLSGLQAGSLLIKPEPCALEHLISKAIERKQDAATARSLSLVVPSSNLAHFVNVDTLRIGQVFDELLANAITFSPAGSTVQIHTGSFPDGDVTPSHALVDVIDHGPGIPESEIETVFDEFIQSSKTTTGAGGKGLGLAICRRIIVAHGGSINASKLPDGGTRIRFTLPLATPTT